MRAVVDAVEVVLMTTDTDTFGTCYCGHSALSHGPCICSQPRSCLDHLGLCDACGCSMYEESRPAVRLDDVDVPLRDAYDSTPLEAR